MTGNDAASPDTALEPFTLEELLDVLAEFHAEPLPPEVALPDALSVLKQRSEAEHSACKALLSGDEDVQRLASLKVWLDQEFDRLAPIIEVRQDRLRPSRWYMEYSDVRLCDNGRLVVAQSAAQDPQPFDYPEMADPGHDLASLRVELELRGEMTLSHQALDGYLRRSGDYELARILSLLQVIEAMAGMRRVLQRRFTSGHERPALMAETMNAFRRYLTLAERHAEFRFPPLVIGVGVSGSGKSRFTKTLVGRLGAVRLSSDVQRMLLHGFSPQAEGDGLPVDIYTREATDKTYQRLATCAGILLDAGYMVCVDGTFLERGQRELLRWQAEARGLPVLLVSFEADDETLRRRISKRAVRNERDESLSLAVLAAQQDAFEDFTDEERLHLVRLDSTADNAAETLASLIEEHIRVL
ncbi:AAA family ATPase [Halomonas denitrificans]|uniref:AAA family ATPase n=1 Tax=Halomonas TaxID=2745 RepID=UPI001A8FBFEC|nr:MULTISPECIES: bifunctional aminoglycoside phosphotransferase/ATP-binding protein [Halomonas]MED5297420.1 AAA family ATPase [Pseudomonadota bacterium]MBN8412800.1 AAA family ATPase [Halomonas litopenaei]MBY5925095.1 AAA family ATPase [Halomonas sp. DP4Y7-2]MBY5928890.1 AAA family ATPase [Halomonas sp. DP8Y7-3]MBY5968012.1 AAA family ATPase [Halomonas denitrificans]